MICDKQSAGDISLTFKNYLAHELVHVTQYRLTKRTDFRFNLLEMALLEGSADYVATLLLEETLCWMISEPHLAKQIKRR